MDGIIIDSELEYLKIELEFARTKNPRVQLEDLFGMVGSSREDAWSCMARAVCNGQTWQQLRDEFRSSVDIYAQMDYRRIFRKEIPGILDRLQGMGLRLALASSTGLPVINRVLTENNIHHYFEEIVSGAQFKRSKPDPEIYHYTAGKLKLPENQCLAVEDYMHSRPVCCSNAEGGIFYGQTLIFRKLQFSCCIVIDFRIRKSITIQQEN